MSLRGLEERRGVQVLCTVEPPQAAVTSTEAVWPASNALGPLQCLDLEREDP